MTLEAWLAPLLLYGADELSALTFNPRSVAWDEYGSNG